MNDDKKTADAEQEFKKKVFELFSAKSPDEVHIDEEGFIVVPIRKRHKNDNPNTNT